MIGAGLLISVAWLGITLQGWSAMKRHADLARTFASTHSASADSLDNPLRPSTDEYHHLVLLVITVFMLMSLGLGYLPPLWSERSDPCVNALLRSLASALH